MLGDRRGGVGKRGGTVELPLLRHGVVEAVRQRRRAWIAGAGDDHRDQAVEDRVRTLFVGQGRGELGGGLAGARLAERPAASANRRRRDRPPARRRWRTPCRPGRRSGRPRRPSATGRRCWSGPRCDRGSCRPRRRRRAPAAREPAPRPARCRPRRPRARRPPRPAPLAPGKRPPGTGDGRSGSGSPPARARPTSPSRGRRPGRCRARRKRRRAD